MIFRHLIFSTQKVIISKAKSGAHSSFISDFRFKMGANFSKTVKIRIADKKVDKSLEEMVLF